MSMPIDQTRQFMLASYVPLLKNQLLCDFLKNMDEEETKKLDQEADRLVREDEKLQTEIAKIDEAYSWKNILKDGAYTAVGFGTTFGVGRLAYENTEMAQIKFGGWGGLYGWGCSQAEERDRVNNIGTNSVKQGLLSAAISGFAVVWGELANCAINKSSAKTNNQSVQKKYTQEINSERILRLQDKIREIEKKLLQTQNDPGSDQFNLTKDYFHQKKLEIEVDLKNNATLSLTVRTIYV